eukprot:1595468-Pleurochrysis_carterae.AAC.1
MEHISNGNKIISILSTKPLISNKNVTLEGVDANDIFTRADVHPVLKYTRSIYRRSIIEACNKLIQQNEYKYTLDPSDYICDEDVYKDERTRAPQFADEMNYIYDTSFEMDDNVLAELERRERK